jgi:hypothetical protein
MIDKGATVAMSPGVGLAFATVALISLAPGWLSAQPVEPSTKEIAAWIEQLSSRRFAEREAASAKLRALNDVPPELEQATMSSDAEVASRAKSIVREIKDRRLILKIQKCVEPINKIGLDLFVQKMAEQDGYATEDRLTMIQALADGLSGCTQRLGHPGFLQDARHWATTLIDPASASLIGSVQLGGGKDFRNLGHKGFILLSPKSMPQLLYSDESILIILGDFEGAQSIRNSLLICTGKIGPISSLKNSIVLTPHGLKFGGGLAGLGLLDGSFIQASDIGGDLISTNNIFLSREFNPVFLSGSFGDQFLKSENGPLQLIKMFDPANFGLHAKFANGQTRVASLTANSSFAKAGLRSDDELLSVNRTKWSSCEQFRVELRKALVKDSLTLQVRRNNQVIELRVKTVDEPKDDER